MLIDYRFLGSTQLGWFAFVDQTLDGVARIILLHPADVHHHIVTGHLGDSPGNGGSGNGVKLVGLLSGGGG